MKTKLEIMKCELEDKKNLLNMDCYSDKTDIITIELEKRINELEKEIEEEELRKNFFTGEIELSDEELDEVNWLTEEEKESEKSRRLLWEIIHNDRHIRLRSAMKEYKNYYWYFPEEDLKFANREDAQKKFGRAYFNKLHREKRIYMIVDD